MEEWAKYAKVWVEQYAPESAKFLVQKSVPDSAKDLSDNQKELLKKITDRYEAQTSSYYAAARLWVDEIIDPIQTRCVISEGIAAANHNPHIPEFKTGVFQV